MLGVTPQNVAAYAPGAPPVAQSLIDRADRWAERQLSLTGTPLTPANTPDVQDAVSAYSLSLLPAAVVLTEASAGGQLTGFEAVGELKLTYAAHDGAALSQVSLDWLGTAWVHLRDAGVPARRSVIGASR